MASAYGCRLMAPGQSFPHLVSAGVALQRFEADISSRVEIWPRPETGVVQ